MRAEPASATATTTYATLPITFDPTTTVQEIVGSLGNAAIPHLLKHNPRIFNNIRKAIDHKKARKLLGGAAKTMEKLLDALDSWRKHHMTKRGQLRISQKAMGMLTGSCERTGYAHSHKMQEAGILTCVQRGCQETGASILRVNLSNVLDLCARLPIGRKVDLKQTRKFCGQYQYGIKNRTKNSTSTYVRENRKSEVDVEFSIESEERKEETATRPYRSSQDAKAKRPAPRRRKPKKRYPRKEEPDKLRAAARRKRLAERDEERRANPLDKKVDEVDARCLQRGYYRRSVWDEREKENLKALRVALTRMTPAQIISMVASAAYATRNNFGQPMFNFTPVRRDSLSYYAAEKERADDTPQAQEGGIEIKISNLDALAKYEPLLDIRDVGRCRRHAKTGEPPEKMRFNIDEPQEKRDAMIELTREMVGDIAERKEEEALLVESLTGDEKRVYTYNKTAKRKADERAKRDHDRTLGMINRKPEPATAEEASFILRNWKRHKRLVEKPRNQFFKKAERAPVVKPKQEPPTEEMTATPSSAYVSAETIAEVNRELRKIKRNRIARAEIFTPIEGDE